MNNAFPNSIILAYQEKGEEFQPMVKSLLFLWCRIFFFYLNHSCTSWFYPNTQKFCLNPFIKTFILLYQIYIFYFIFNSYKVNYLIFSSNFKVVKYSVICCYGYQVTSKIKSKLNQDLEINSTVLFNARHLIF